MERSLSTVLYYLSTDTSCTCRPGFVNVTSLHVKDCAWTAAAPHQTSKLSPNTALVSLPPLLHTLLKPKCPAARFFFFSFYNTPLHPFWSHLSSKATALLLLGGICENHDAVKLMLKELSEWKKMSRVQVVCVCVCTDTSLRRPTAEGSSFGL